METIEQYLQTLPKFPQRNYQTFHYSHWYNVYRNSDARFNYLSYYWYFITYKHFSIKRMAKYFSSLYSCETNENLKKKWKRLYEAYATTWKKKYKEKTENPCSFNNISTILKQTIPIHDLREKIIENYARAKSYEWQEIINELIDGFEIYRYKSMRTDGVFISIHYINKNIVFSKHIAKNSKYFGIDESYLNIDRKIKIRNYSIEFKHYIEEQWELIHETIENFILIIDKHKISYAAKYKVFVGNTSIKHFAIV